MTVEEFRELCLSLRGASEKMPFTEPKYSPCVVFEVGGKWFGFVDIEKFDFCVIKCDPDRSRELQASYEGITPGWHMNKKYWISIYFHGDVPDALIRELVTEAHNIVFNKLPSKIRQSIR